MRILVDGMGGDHAPEEIVKGCVEASQVVSAEICIFGDEEKINQELKKYDRKKGLITVHPTTEVIDNHDAPVKAIRNKKDASMVVALETLKRGEGDAFISAGNTGALMAGGLFILGRIPGIDRPAIATVLPGLEHPFLLLDSGANSECKPNNYLEFAIMGSIFMEKVFSIEKPEVGLINMGAEESKGPAVIKSAHGLLSQSSLNFVGNVESRYLFDGVCHVAVCDGFIGNVFLKTSEGIANFITLKLKEKIMSSGLSQIGGMMMKKQLKEFKQEFDYSEFGGAPILGVKGPIIKIHGSSKANSVKNAIIKAIPFAESKAVSLIHDEIVKFNQTNAEES